MGSPQYDKYLLGWSYFMYSFQASNSLRFPDISFCSPRYMDVFQIYPLFLAYGGRLDNHSLSNMMFSLSDIRYGLRHIEKFSDSFYNYSKLKEWRTIQDDLVTRSLHTTMLFGRDPNELSIETASAEVLPLLLHCKDGKQDCKNVKKFMHPEHLLCYTYSPHSGRKAGLSNGVTMAFLTAGGIMQNLTEGTTGLFFHFGGGGSPHLYIINHVLP